MRTCVCKFTILDGLALIISEFDRHLACLLGYFQYIVLNNDQTKRHHIYFIN